MPRVGLIGAFIVLAVGGAVATDASHLRLQAVAPWNDYDDFIKLNVDQRRDRFAAISAENKAMIVQTHAQRWLRNNRGRLTTSEVGVFEEIIAFITSDLYRERADDTLDKREQELRTTMRCRVSPDDVREATNVLRAERASPSQRATWTYLNQARCWIDWFMEGLVDSITSQPR